MARKNIGSMSLEDAAKQSAGNWKHFESFAWGRSSDLDDPDRWAIFYTHNRDSDTLEESNARAIAKDMKPYLDGKGALKKSDPDVVPEDHAHWAVGWVEGYSIRVFNKKNQITPAFRKYHELQEKIAEYPVLDENDYSERELEEKYQMAEATIRSEGRDLVKERAPKDWPDRVWGIIHERSNSGASLGGVKYGWERAQEALEGGTFRAREKEAVIEALQELKLLDPEAKT